MAVHIKLIRNNIKSSSSYGKYFAKAVSQGEVTMNELAEEAASTSVKGPKTAISSTTSARVSKPCGRQALSPRQFSKTSMKMIKLG